jgi:hypothetical protein
MLTLLTTPNLVDHFHGERIFNAQKPEDWRRPLDDLGMRTFTENEFGNFLLGDPVFQDFFA